MVAGPTTEAVAGATPRRLRIAVLNRVFARTGGGAESYSVALVEQLAAWHEIHVFAQSIEHNWPGVHYHRLGGAVQRPRWVNQLVYAATTWWATRRGFDVVHSHELVWHGQVQTVHVLPIRHNLLHGLGGVQRALRWLKIATSPRLLVYLALEAARMQVSGRRQVVLTAPGLRATVQACYPDSAPRLHVIPPGVASPPGPADSAVRLAARRSLGLPSGGQGVLLVGNDYRKKGLGTLIEALARLDSDTWLAVVGNPVQQPQFLAQAQAAGLGHRVHFLGRLRDMAPAYRAADCLAHPTREDTFAMVVLEALAHGLPAVVSGARYCGIAELLHDGVDALLLPDPTDATALAAQLKRLLQDLPLREQLVAIGLVLAKRMSWEQAAEVQDQIYQSVAAL